MGIPFAQPHELKTTTAKSKHAPADFAAAKEAFLNDVIAVVTMDDIPPELVLNWDQSGIHFVPASTWAMGREGSRRVEINGAIDKRQITAVLCGSLTGDFLPLQLIYPRGKPNIATLNMCSPATGT